MYYDIKKLPDLPVVIGTWYEGFKFAQQGPQYSREANAVLNAQETPVFYLLDLSDLHTISVEGVMKAAASGARRPNSNTTHPMNRGNIMVTRESIIELSVKGLNSATYGNIEFKLFDNLDDALEYVRNES